MTRWLSFDVDGTILDTRELNERAYREVGVEVPDHAWGLTWQAWLPAATGYPLESCEVLHRAKVQIYEKLVEEVDLRPLLLPPGRVAHAHLARSRGPIRYLTAGSGRAATIMLARLGILGPIQTGLTYAQRAALLGAMPHDTTYVDDRLDTIVRLRHEPGAAKLNLIHYSGQTYEKLLEDMLWSRSTR